MGVRYFFSNIWYKLRYEKRVQLTLVISLLVLINIGIWGGILYAVKSQKAEAAPSVDFLPEVKKRAAVPKDELIPRHLDGMIVAAEDANEQPVAVMIENAAFEGVRPQYGLSRALVIYEVIVEGGITRLMAIFGGENSDKIGPVRSARPTYLEFASEYDAVYTHAGGSPEALASIDGLGIRDLNALGADSRFFWRDLERFAPHNLFTSSELLTLALRDKKFDQKDPTFQSWKFKDPAPLEKRPEEAPEINIYFSTPEYDVSWKYDRQNNNYQRYNGGQLQTDAQTGETLTAKNVIVQIVPPAMEAGDKGRVNFAVTGQGKAYVFREGETLEGTWEKPNRLSRTKFFDANHKEIELVRGNVWMEILPEDKTLEIQ